MRLICLFALVLGVLSFSLRAFSPTAVDKVLVGTIYTANNEQPWAEAIAVHGNKIIFVGTEEDAKKLAGPTTDWRNYGNRLISPGFNDNHIHLFYAAASLNEVDLRDVTDLQIIRQRIRAYARKNPTGWVIGQGWLYGAFPNGAPHKQYMDDLLPDRPALIWGYDGHSAWANSKALELAGINKDTPDPKDGVIARDPITGDPTGMLKEDPAVNLVRNIIPPKDPEQKYQELKKGIQYLNAHGVTAAQDAGVDYYASTFAARELPVLERLVKESALSLRLSVSLFMREENASATIAEVVRLKDEKNTSPFLKFGTIKTYVDGVIEAGTAALLEPYVDTDNRGHINWTGNSLERAVVAADAQNLQVYLHAIGDRAVRRALDAYASANKINGPKDRRSRIEHIETINPLEYARFKDLSVIASMQPLHAEPNENILDVYTKTIGPERTQRAFGWRAIEQANIRLTFGSDWSVVSPNVMFGLYTAATRKSRKGLPDDGWIPDQTVTLQNALKHYTIDGAYGAQAEAEVGSLEPGKLADIVVLSHNPFDEPIEQLLSTKVILTIVDGNIVYESRP